MAELLVADDLAAGHGAGTVLDGVSFELHEGDSLALLGRNGVGKTTLILTIMGMTQKTRGRLKWRGKDITALPPHERAISGIGWVPQERMVFPSLTVEEHLTVVARKGPWTLPRIYELFPRLAERRKNFGNQLSGGEQQMLAIARALMVNPSLLLLDEPMEGLAPLIIQELARIIRQMIASGDMSVLLVEQHARLALGLTRSVVVLDRGQIVHRGPSEGLLADPTLLEQLTSVA
jgi:branched-chain amino acid transport system ATP-binding protein